MKTIYNKDLGFIPSVYQQAVFDFVKHGTGNAVVSAKAGSAKTTTMVAAMRMVHPSKRCLFIAFNKSIVEELGKKVSGNTNCEVSTVHSLGLKMIERNLETCPTVDEYKYNTYLRKEADRKDVTIDKSIYFSNCLRLMELSRMNLCQTEREVLSICGRYGISCVDDECKTVVSAMRWGSRNTQSVDYTDMVWLPYELGLSPKGLQYDWVFLDEGQDFSLAYVELVKKCFKRGTRMMAVLDEKQSINGFAGACPEAVEMLKSFPHTITLDLPICYRCDSNIIRRAQRIVPGIQCRDNAPVGIVDDNAKLSDIREGDMVLSRYRAPLVKLYIALGKMGVKCRMNGESGWEYVKDMVESCKETEVGGMFGKGIMAELYLKVLKERNRISAVSGMDKRQASLSKQIVSMFDTVSLIGDLSIECRNKEELLEKINSVFAEKNEGVLLSTVHKAKGLEADNVYIICPSSMPSVLAESDFDKSQEMNLIYVSITRAKHKLGYVSEDDFPLSGAAMKPDTIVGRMDFLESVIKNIYGEKCIDIEYIIDNSRQKLQNAEEGKKENDTISTKQRDNMCSSKFSLSELD